MAKDEQISIRMDKDLLAQAKAIAEKLERSVAWVLHKAIENGLSKVK